LAYYFPSSDATDSFLPVSGRFHLLSVQGRTSHSCVRRPGMAPLKSGGMQALAAMTSHIPCKGEQMVRYYEYYSNASRGWRKKSGMPEIIPCLLQPELTDAQFWKNWSRLIQKLYEVDPLTCPKCREKIRVVAFIEDPDVVKKISRITSPTRFTPWMLIFKKPLSADTSSHPRIDRTAFCR